MNNAINTKFVNNTNFEGLQSPFESIRPAKNISVQNVSEYTKSLIFGLYHYNPKINFSINIDFEEKFNNITITVTASGTL